MACDEWCRRDYCILRVAVGEKVKDMFYVDRATTAFLFLVMKLVMLLA